jgi:hypothetical protein
MSDQDNPSPFLRVPSRSEKYSTLLLNAVLAVSSGSVMFWILDADLRNPVTWICAYGSVFFGMNTFHSWLSCSVGLERAIGFELRSTLSREWNKES